MRIYLVGRKSSEGRMHAFIQELHAINPKAEVIWTEGEVALLAETTRICEAIKIKESRVDLLFLTTGYAPFGTREAEAPKVVSGLAGGLEQATIDFDDLDLKKPGNFGSMKAQIQYTAMNTTTLEKLANENPSIIFIHSWPGWVNTGNVRRGADLNSIMACFVWLNLEPLIGQFSFSDEESGQRHLFQSTSAAFGGRGVPWRGKPGMNSLEKPADGLFLVNYKCDRTPNA
ncbi:hypothetical protein H2198_007777 [Neophaeococcomyces mojaviensis]|uniref:Uncharacterized protein n=1 Tax=Neophaeococcomyces mojaviensis TaxID=3383035 RepID=A0ACC2ZZQ1_9EURO|nr:hypothetical protein H2198_007777 [Knufia sp. JES_112]